MAASRLLSDGYRILARNWRYGRLELDLIAARRGVVAFVEVKTRRSGGAQNAAEALAPAQQRRIRRAAEAWIHAHPGVGREFRFDVMAVEVSGVGPPAVRHVEDAFHGEDAGFRAG